MHALCVDAVIMGMGVEQGLMLHIKKFQRKKRHIDMHMHMNPRKEAIGWVVPKSSLTREINHPLNICCHNN